jgi:hypothetical protein
LLTTIVKPPADTNAIAGSRRDLADEPFIFGLLIVFLVGCAARFYQLDHTHEKRLLASLGFNEVATPPLTSPRQLIFQPLSTNISLWKRPGRL